MYLLHIEHPVPDYNSWKEAFDSDPVGRIKMGVKRYHIMRPVDDPNFVMIELAFETANQAEMLLTALRNVWKDADGKIIFNPQARISEVVEIGEIEKVPVGD
jgi:hypothetical protein